MAIQKISLRRKGASFALGDTLYPITDYNYLINKPNTFTPTAHRHDWSDIDDAPSIPTTLDGIADGTTRKLSDYVKLTGNQTITGIKTINTSDLRMNGGSVAYLRPVTTGGWARGFWWQKNATDDVPYERIGGIGVLGSNLSVSKFYIGYGDSPWSGSALEIFPNYTNAKGLKVNNVDVVLTNRTIAGLNLSADRSVSDVKSALGYTKSDIGLGNVDDTSDATKKTNFTGSITSGNTGFVVGGDVFTALSGKASTSHNHDGTYLKSFTETDPTVAAWAKTANATAIPVTKGGTGLISMTNGYYYRYNSSLGTMQGRSAANVRSDIGANNAANINTGRLPAAQLPVNGVTATVSGSTMTITRYS